MSHLIFIISAENPEVRDSSHLSPLYQTKDMEIIEDDYSFKFPSDIRMLRMNEQQEGHKLKGYGKDYSFSQFKPALEEFERKYGRAPQIIIKDEIFEPLFYLIAKHASHKRISDEVRKEVGSLCSLLS